MSQIDANKQIQRLREAMDQRDGKWLIHALGIEILEIKEGFIRGSMPVDARTHQLYGMLHGGASVAFAETLCSMGASLFINHDTHKCVGLEINANHIRGVMTGTVFGEARPIHVGRRTQLWAIEIKNEAGDLVCLSRCTMAVVEHK